MRSRPSPPKSIFALAAIALASAAVYTLFVRRWHNRWGATDAEMELALPGDQVVAEPNMNSTRVITIHAEPRDIWPWLVQMGRGRGGLYSYDWLDIAFRILDAPSAENILPEYQELNEGDVIPIGVNDRSDDDFYVHVCVPDVALVIGANDPKFRQRVSWAMVLIPEGPNRTRLAMRVRGDVEMNAPGILMYAMIDPASFIMLRKQMLNLKRLAEATRAKRELKERQFSQ
jgi:hypothetical protein